MLRSVDLRQFARFVINGLVATATHFGVLTLLVEVVGIPSKGMANAMAAVAGILISFAGNKLFVFATSAGSARSQLAKFVFLYASLAFVSGCLMWLWSDLLGLDYRIGFVLISGVQLILSFLGNRILVFR